METATEQGGVALLEGESLLAEQIQSEPPPRAASLLPQIDALLRSCERRLDEVTGVALSVGPGSFTGLRVGLSTVLGLCFETARPVAPVATLAALSLQAGGAPRVAPWLDARKGQVYAGLYSGGGVALRPDAVTEPLAWLRSLEGRGPLTFLGPGADLYRNEIESVLGDSARIVHGPLGGPRAASVGVLGARLLASGRGVAASEVELRYLRPPDAVPASAGRGQRGPKPVA
ncbi:MAG: tRNA (adenosine(37)-N6)-threonylcarbamoyltransferase complex dimerization subunit type 1 TsaB [Myxococcota bacterium]